MTWKKNFVDYRKVEKVDLDGYTFDSKLESALYVYLKSLEGTELEFLECKPNVHLTRARILMIPDFKAFDLALQEEVYFEAKGFETEKWILKRKLWTVYGPGRLRVYKGSAERFRLVEEIIPKG